MKYDPSFFLSKFCFQSSSKVANVVVYLLTSSSESVEWIMGRHKKICLLTVGNMLDLYIYIVQLLDIKNFPCLTVYGPIIQREMPETLILWRKRETEILAQGNFMFSVNLEVRYQSKRWQFYQDDKWQQRVEKKICCTL